MLLYSVSFLYSTSLGWPPSLSHIWHAFTSATQANCSLLPLTSHTQSSCWQGTHQLPDVAFATPFLQYCSLWQRFLQGYLPPSLLLCLLLLCFTLLVYIECFLRSHLYPCRSLFIINFKLPHSKIDCAIPLQSKPFPSLTVGHCHWSILPVLQFCLLENII